MFGNVNGNAGSTNDCLTYANVASGGACVVAGGLTTFAAYPSSILFGPLPADVTISNLHAVAANGLADQTVRVLDNVNPTTLACTTATTGTCTNSTTTVPIPAGDFLQVQITTGSGSWRVTFQISPVAP